MSHFTVMVIGPANDEELAAAMEPYNENTPAEPYKDYEEGEPCDHWSVRSTLSDAQHFVDGTGLDERTRKGVSWGSPPVSPEVKRAEYAAAADRAHRFLSGEITWEKVRDLYAEWFPEEGNERYEVDEGGMFTISTYPKGAKWDWHEVGGRWAGSLQLKEGVTPAMPLNFSWGWEDVPDYERPGPDKADRAQARDIDWDSARLIAAAEADVLYDRWEKFLAEFGQPPRWEPQGQADIAAYREAHNADPRTAAFREAFKDSLGIFGSPNDFKATREEHIEYAAAGAAPCFAMLVPGEGWMEPGKMGWFGTDSSTDDDVLDYRRKANQIIDALPPDTWVTVVDCHI